MMKSEIILENGKYTVTHENGANLQALRYGQPWQDLVGNNLVLCMAEEIEHLRNQQEMLIQAITDTAENIGMIEKGLGPVTGSQALMLLSDISRDNLSTSEQPVQANNTAIENQSSPPKFSFSRPR